MNGVVPYTSSVLMAMSSAALAMGNIVQVQTSVTRKDVEECTEIGRTVVVPEVEIESRAFFNGGVKRQGTGMSLRLRGQEYPRVVLSHFTDVEVPELGIKLPAKGFNIERLHNRIWGNFLELEDVAKREGLDECQRSQWESYGRYFDYGRYRAESAPLVRTFGKLVLNSGEGVVVRWLNGKEEKLRGTLAQRVSVVKDYSTRNFSALVRFVNYKVDAIEDVRPDCDVELSNDDLSWMTEWQNG